MKMFLKKLRNQFGMSLVEVTIASALAGGLALVVAQISKNMGSSAKGIETKFEYALMHAEVQGLLTSSAAGTNTFTGFDLTTCNGASTAAAPAACQVTNFRDANNAVRYIAGTYANGGTSGKSATASKRGTVVEIDSAWISNWVEAGTTNTGDAILNIRYENLGYSNKTSVGAQWHIKQMYIHFTVDTNDVVTEAQANTTGDSGPWQNNTAGTGIFYNAGGVQVGAGATAAGQLFDGPAMTMGTGNTASAINSWSFGATNNVTGSASGAFGTSNVVSNGVSIGTSNNTGAAQAIALGLSNTVNGGATNIALGTSNSVTDAGGGAIAIGKSHNITGFTTGKASVAIGTQNTLTNGQSVAIGSYSAASANFTHVLGLWATASADGANALGNRVTSSAQGAFSIGDYTGAGVRTNATTNSFMATFAGGYRFYTDGTTTNPNGIFFDTAGKVGIGTAGPLSKLSVTSGTYLAGSGNSDGNSIATIFGYGNASSATGVYGKVLPIGDDTKQVGVRGDCTGANVSAYCTGVFGYGSYATAGVGRTYGVHGWSGGTGTEGWNYGVSGWLLGTRSGAAIYGSSDAAAGDVDVSGGVAGKRWAGYFNGNVNITGSLESGSSSATGTNATALGTNNTASGTDSFATGTSNTVSIGQSFASGASNVVSTGGDAVAMGASNTVTGWGSMAQGQSNQVAGAKSTAFGWVNNVSGDNSQAIGTGNIVTGDYSIGMGLNASPAHAYSIVMADNSTTTDLSTSAVNQFRARFAGGYTFYSNSTLTSYAALPAGANAWSYGSDRNTKENFEKINGEDLLFKIAHLPILKWNYIGSPDNEKYIGPMAQDFDEIFQLGQRIPTMINSSVITGVTLAGVQALEKRTSKLIADNKALKKEQEKLLDRIERLEKLLAGKNKK